MANLLSTSITGTATTSDSVVIGGTFANNPYNSVASTRLMLGGGDAPNNYSIGTNLENFGGNYTKLDLRWHTGIRMGAQPGYGGIRFFSDETLTTRIMSIGETDANIRIDNNLWIGGAGGWITDLFNAKQNASTAITTSNIGSQSVRSAGRIADPERIGFNVGGESNRFYPVAIYTGAGPTSQQYSEFIIERGGYEDPGYTGIGFSTFNARFTYKPSGWGYAATYFNLEQLSQTTPMLGDYFDQYQSSQAIIWLRGATRYNIYSVYGGITLLFSNEEGGSYPMAYGTYDPIDSPQEKATTAKYYDSTVRYAGTIYTGSNAVIHAGNIGSQSVSYASSAGSAPNASNLNASYGVTAGAGNGLKFWGGDDTYKISMGNSDEYHYGPVTDYSIKTVIDSVGATRGFTWGVNGVTPIAALNVGNGNMQIAGSFTTTSVNAPSGYTSYGNPWGTANSAYFPNGITTAGSDNWIYGHTFVGNAPTNGNGHEFWADGNMKSTGHHYLDANYGQTIVGRYSSTVYQGVWAMGDSYKLPMDGSTTGSLYGLAWSHPNAGGVAGNLNTHGLLVMENGTFLAAISGSIRARDDMRAPIFYDSADTSYYVDPNSYSRIYRTSTHIAPSPGVGSSNWVNDFNATPTSSMSFGGDLSAGGPQGAWWFQQNFRHSNSSNYWGTQVAWGWEDNANELWQRNVQAGSWSGWVRYINTNNYTGILDSRYQQSSTAINTSNIGSQSVSYASSAGNADTVDSLHASDFVRAYTTTADNIDSDCGQSFKTFDPVPSGTPPLASPNIRTINIGENFARRTQLAFDYASDLAYFRRRNDSGWQTWREFIHSGNIGSQSVSYADSAGSAPNAGNVNTFYNVSAGDGYGLRFWGGSDSYKISMGVGGLYQYGPVIDYSIKTQMDAGSTGRGFTWGNNGVTPVAALNATSGDFQVAGTIANGSIWINNGVNNNNYNENIRLFDAPNGVSVIGFSASGTGGTPKTSILGYSDRFETRVSDTWEQRIYGGYVEARGSFRAPIFYDSADTTYYLDPNSSVSGIFAGSVGINNTSPINTAWGNATNTKQLSIDGANYAVINLLGGSRRFSMGVGDDIFYMCYDNTAGRHNITVNGSGQVTIPVDVRSPIFYDSANTAYYVDPNATSNIFDLSITGGAHKYLAINPGNGYEAMVRYVGGSGLSWYVGKRMTNQLVGTESFHFYSEAAGATVGGIDTSGNMITTGSMRAPIFYDSNDTTYYGDFASTSWLRHLSVGDVNASNDGSWNARLNLTGSSHARLDVKSNSDGIITTMYSHAGQGVGRVGTMSNHPLTFIVNGNVAGYAYANYLQGVDSVRAPIFYDSNDTTYYLDPANSSLSLNVAGYTKSKFTYRNNSVAGLPGQDNPVKTATGVLATLSGNGGGNEYIIIKTRVPQDSYQMGCFTIDLFANYADSNTKTTISLGGYWNPESNGGFIAWEYNTTNPNVRPNIQVMRDVTDGNTCFAIQIGKSYPVVVARDLYLGYNSSDIEGWLDWSIFGADDLGGYTNGDTVVCRAAMPINAWFGNSYISENGTYYGTIFYDTNDTNYYLDPASTSRLNLVNDNGGETYGVKYFYSNKGATTSINATDSPSLQAFSSDNGPAFMSFHRNGQYAVNFGLDYDNVIRVGGWSASSNRMQLDMSGNVTFAGDVTAYSDARVKENVHTIENALNKTLQLRGVTYNRTDSEDKSTKVGVIAQEVLEVVPEVVNQDASGMYNVSYGNLTAVLIEAIKEQQKQIDELKDIINGLTK